MEWVEIIEPRTKEHMYANLTTGECVWDPPVGVPVKKTDDNQWWELFDQNTQRFYYYNATSQKTVWHRPSNCDIIPLAKLQTLKLNTEPSGDDSVEENKLKESVSTQTSGRCIRSNKNKPPTSAEKNLHHKISVSCETQTSPGGSPRSFRRVHHHSHSHRHHSSTSQHRAQPKTNQSQDSGRSSDSSSRASLENHRLIESPHRSRHQASISTSTSTPIFEKKPLQEVNSTQMKANIDKYNLLSSNTNLKADLNLSIAKQRSFDVETSLGVGGCYSNYGHENLRTRSKGPTNKDDKTVKTPAKENVEANTELARSHSFIQRRETFNDEEDSMHEKYFIPGNQPGSKSTRELDTVSSTPSHRKHHNYKGCTYEHLPKRGDDSENESSSPSPISDSPTSPASMSQKARKVIHPNMFANIEPPSRLSSHSDESKTSTFDEKHRRTQMKQMKEETYKKPPIREYQQQPPPPHKVNPSRNLSRENYDFRQVDGKDMYGGENGNLSNTRFASMDRATPLYSNLDYSSYYADPKSQAHLLPLHQYILEQAKLSGCYKFGDSLLDEMDSVHSEDEASLDRPEYDSDEFADDEGMSNQGDSSSQEYLDEPNYYEQHELLRKYQPEYKNNVEYIESLESRMAVNTMNQGVYYSPIARVPPANETQHASLKRKKDVVPPVAPASNLYSPITEKTERPVSLASQQEEYPMSPRLALSHEKKLPSESDIEKYAQGHLNIHKKGIFRKKFSVRDMLSWSKDSIRKPMLVVADKAIKKDACDLFKLVQIYMSDRKAKVGMTLNNVALDIITLSYNKPSLRDELYIQICRQTTENPRRESLRRGWELMAICLNFVPPSPKFQSYLEGYMNRHRDPGFDFPEVVKWPIHVQISHYATVSCKRLERIGINGKKQAKKATIDEIDQARLQIFRASMFGNTLEEVMHLQKERFPNRRLPWVQTILSEEILRLQGAQTEGIFRVSADVDEVNSMKTKIDHWELPIETMDAHAPASLLKLWYRELYEPLIPDSLYTECVTHHDDPEYALAIVQRLPNLNRLVLCYLIRFLQIFSRAEVVQATKMDASNLAMVMAPNCLRCTSHDPRVIFDNARKEMGFIRTLIQSLDTSFMEGVV